MHPISYSQIGDNMLPDIILKEQTTEPLTKYGLLRRTYLKDHRPIMYSRLILTEQLTTHLINTQQSADERLTALMGQLVKRNPPPEKTLDPIAWAAHMNALEHSANEVILTELIYE